MAQGFTKTIFGIPAFLVFFVHMNSYRSILSLFLLSAYALLLLHDFIPHTHHVHQGDVPISSTVHHNHGHHHHSHDHHGEDENKSNEYSEKGTIGLLLTHSHSHAGHDGHHHVLSYKTASKDKLIPQGNDVQYLVGNYWNLPDRVDDSISIQMESLLPLYRQDLSTPHGLRGPPTLG